MAARQTSLSLTISQSLLKLMSIESVMPSNHLILCHPLLLLPSAFPSIRVSSNESALCIRWPKDWCFSISSSKEYSGLIFSRMDWFDLLAVQGTLHSLLQHHSSKASISAFSLLYRWQHGINTTFTCTGKPNNACLLYCGGLELKRSISKVCLYWKKLSNKWWKRENTYIKRFCEDWMSVNREEWKVLKHRAQHIGSSIMLADSVINGIQKRVRQAWTETVTECQEEACLELDLER